MKADQIILIHKKHYGAFKAGTLDMNTVDAADYAELKPFSSEISADQSSDKTSYFAKTPRSFDCSFLRSDWLKNNLQHSDNDAFFEITQGSETVRINTELSNKILIAYEKGSTVSFFDGVIKTDSIGNDPDLIDCTAKDFSILFSKIADHRIPNRPISGDDYINEDGKTCYRGTGIASNGDVKSLFQLLIKKASLYYFGDETTLKASTDYSWKMSSLETYNSAKLYEDNNFNWPSTKIDAWAAERVEGCGISFHTNEITMIHYAYLRESLGGHYREHSNFKIKKYARGTETYSSDIEPNEDPSYSWQTGTAFEIRKKFRDDLAEILDYDIDENDIGGSLASIFQLIGSQSTISYEVNGDNVYTLSRQGGRTGLYFTGSSFYDIVNYLDREEDEDGEKVFYPKYYSISEYLKALTYLNDLSCEAKVDSIIFRNRFWEDRNSHIVTESEVAYNGYQDKRVILDNLNNDPFKIMINSDSVTAGLKYVVESYYNRLRGIIKGESSYIISYLMNPALKDIKRGDFIHFQNKNFKVSSLKPSYKRHEVILQELEYGISNITADSVLWNYSDEVTITWKNNVSGNVDIYLVKDADEKLVYPAVENTGSFTFTVDQHIDGADYKIKVCNSLDKNIFGLGNQLIECHAYNLTVTPFPDNLITEGMVQQIRWISNYYYGSAGSLKIELECDGVTELIADTHEVFKIYDWDVPTWSAEGEGYAADKLLLKMTLTDTGAVYYSEPFGSINVSNNPVIEDVVADTVAWQYDTSVTLTWTTNFVGKVDILLKNATHEQAIIEDVDNSGSHTFSFRSYYPGDYNIIIKSRTGSTEGTSAATVNVSGDYLVIKDFGVNRNVEEGQGIQVMIDTNLTGTSNVYCLAGDNGPVLTVKISHELGTICWWDVPAWHTGGTGEGYSVNDPLERRRLKLTHNGNNYFGTYFGTSSSVS